MDLDLEADLLLAEEDIAVMKKKSCEKELNLDEYFDFLEEVAAFQSKKPKAKFFMAEFEL